MVIQITFHRFRIFLASVRGFLFCETSIRQPQTRIARLHNSKVSVWTAASLLANEVVLGDDTILQKQIVLGLTSQGKFPLAAALD